MQRDTLITSLNEYLRIEAFKDYCVNGLQIEGKTEIRRVATAVSVTQGVIERAIDWGADLLLVHHGFFWNQSPQSLLGYRRVRMKAMLEAELNLVAYHLPLDAHPKVGNNACLAAALGLQDVTPFGLVNGVAVGCAGRVEGLSADEVLATITSVCGGIVASFLAGPARVTNIGIVTGGAGRMLEHAPSAQLDLYLTGEAVEDSMAVAEELGVHFVAAGHHRTEVFGVRALGEHLTSEYGLETCFLGVENPI